MNVRITIPCSVSSLGHALQLTLVVRKKSLRGVAKETGVSAATISRFVHNPSRANLTTYIRLAKWLNLSAEDLQKLTFNEGRY